MKTRSRTRLMINFCIACCIFVSTPFSAVAATVELSATMKKAFDKITAVAPTEQSEQLRTTYQTILINQEKSYQLDQAIKQMNAANDEAEDKLKLQMKQINAAKLTNLTNQLQQARDRYNPLYATYSTLSKQLTAIRKLKNKELTAVYQVRVDAAKLLVELAREDVRQKNQALKDGKNQTTAIIKRIRETLSGIEATELKIRTERAAIVALNKVTSSLQQNLHTAIKTNEPKATLQALSTQSTHLGKINTHKTRITQHAKEVENIIKKASELVPKTS